MSEALPKTLPNSVASTTIPLLDVAGYLAGELGALARIIHEASVLTTSRQSADAFRVASVSAVNGV
jgi:hypothetical protein